MSGNTHLTTTNSPWYLYLIENKLGHIYTGITTDPLRRIAQHRGEIKGGAKALKGKAPLCFRAIFEVDNKSHAARLEYQVKQLNRTQKESIITAGKLDALTCVKVNFV
ncbi:GIY-YIG nuclease family protein [Alteromonas sp. D210916BOD_24]